MEQRIFPIGDSIENQNIIHGKSILVIKHEDFDKSCQLTDTINYLLVPYEYKEEFKTSCLKHEISQFVIGAICYY